MMRVALLALLIAAAPVLAADRGRMPEATAVGKPVSCIPLRAIRESHVRSDKVIDFEMNGRRVYRNTLDYACPSLGFQRSFSYETSLSELCSTDIITVLYQSGPTRGATCGLGQFQQVTLVKR